MRLRSLVAWIVIAGLAAGVFVALSSPANSREPQPIPPLEPWQFQPVVVQTWPQSAYSGPRRAEPHETAVAPTPRPTPRLRSLTGTASWGPFFGHVVTRLPRGTRITVTGPLGTWSGLSWGYGPQVRTHRIADLDVSVFAGICGSPSLGLCTVVLRW